MNKRRTIYKGFNKRRKTNNIKIIVMAVGIFIVSGYGYIKIGNSQITQDITKKIQSINSENKFLGYEDYEFEKNSTSESSEVKENTDVAENKNDSDEPSRDIKIAKVDPLNIYTIQVASVQDDKDMDKIETQLLQNKIPYSVVEMEGSKKVQTYTFFEKEATKKYLEDIKKVFPDAFIAEMNVPVLALEYTSKYSYIENISIKLNELIKSFDQESSFWLESESNIDLGEYNTILENRKKIVLDLQKEAEKIDYSDMSIFKDNLINYTKNVSEQIEKASKSANDNKYDISKSLYLSSMQGYFAFINSIKGA